MVTYAEYIKKEIAIGMATKNNKDKVKTRFIELYALTDKNKAQEAEYNTVANAMLLRFRSEQADQKARGLLGKAESESRKNDAHAKILIGLAAIELAQSNTELNKRLLALACAMTSAPTEVIHALLKIEGTNFSDSSIT